ncbi:leukocyte receptor cluster member 1 homolog [Neocloeon triangulifer]|uniref:leukocyte receptor cluster member 1 homolog n=1 Tax=Neocloeon triangulifer TaxID=2078957 RepID=UPI00286F2BCB|nr:leukocyte receptor cluster member 1 homolog [Neocloeon triangulifer]
MNILPHKSWHVRTKKNIARVRKDEAKAAEEKKEEQRRILLAEQEARTEILRNRVRERYDGRPGKTEGGKAPAAPATSTSGHVNFFEDLESGPSKTSGKNIEHEKEAKEEQEKYEKSIGYLTYLGQDTVESTGIKSWYEKRPLRLEEGDVEESRNSKKKKIEEDPLRIFAAFSGIKKPEFKEREIEFHKQNDTSVVKNVIKTELGIKSVKKKHSLEKERDRRTKKKKKEKKKKSKKHKRERKRSNSESEEENPKPKSSIEKLRAERIAREQAERAKAASLLAKVNGTPLPEEPKPKKEESPQIKQKYNSQFNPHLARQNFEEADPWNNQPWNRR